MEVGGCRGRRGSVPGCGVGGGGGASGTAGVVLPRDDEAHRNRCGAVVRARMGGLLDTRLGTLTTSVDVGVLVQEICHKARGVPPFLRKR